MLSFISIVFLASFSLIFTLPQSELTELSSLISSIDCQFYTTLNTLYQCGVKSHLLEYSYKYCQRLVNIRQTFENIQYQDNARQCLQQNLFNKIRQAQIDSITCESFKKLDLESHKTCFSVSYKQLSANDIRQLFSIFKDTTLAFPEFCKLANSVAGHWSQIVHGDLMQFTKKELKNIFPDGDTIGCTIKEVPNVIEQLMTDLTKIVDTVESINNDIILIIEKSKTIRDDFKSIQDIIKEIKNGSISQLDGMKSILQKSQNIIDNTRIIIDTIKNIVKGKSIQNNNLTQVNMNIDRTLQDMITIIDQIEAMTNEVYKVIDNVNTIIDTINDIQDGKKDIFDGLENIVNQIDNGIDNIYSIINTSYTLKETIIDLVHSIIMDVNQIIDNVGGKIDEIVDTTGGKIDEIIDGVTGGIGGFGK